VVASVLLLYRLGDFPLKDWDEAIYAEVSQEILRTGDLVTMHYNHGPYFNKPPLYFWVGHLVIRALGFSEFSSRLPGAVFGALALGATLGLGRALGGALCGWASATILLSTAMFLENGSRHASPDSLLLALSVGAVWAQWQARRAPRARLLPVALLALAVMTKGVGALPLVITLALLHALLGDHRTWRPRDYRWGAALFGGIVLPWYVAQTVLHGAAFWQKHVYFMVWRRATEVGFLYSRGPFYYTTFLVEQLAYLWPLAVVLIWIGLQRKVWRHPRRLVAQLREHREVGFTLLVSVGSPLLLFSLARNHTWWYILPAVPALCVAGGLVAAAAWRATRSTWMRRSGFVAMGVALLLGMGLNVRETVRGQVRNGIAVYGAPAAVAKQVGPVARRLGLKRPLVVFPADSPSIVAYVPFPVFFDPSFPRVWTLGPPILGNTVPTARDGLLLIAQRRSMAAPPSHLRAEVVAEHSGWVLVNVTQRL
jgi:4-amino-4-deoxy-L-arabinose transferase-like glycosyltransferase